MLPRSTVLKRYCLSTKFHIVWYSCLNSNTVIKCFASFSLFNDFATRLDYESVLYCTYLSNENFPENQFFQEVLIKACALF